MNTSTRGILWDAKPAHATTWRDMCPTASHPNTTGERPCAILGWCQPWRHIRPETGKERKVGRPVSAPALTRIDTLTTTGLDQPHELVEACCLLTARHVHPPQPRCRDPSSTRRQPPPPARPPPISHPRGETVRPVPVNTLRTSTTPPHPNIFQSAYRHTLQTDFPGTETGRRHNNRHETHSSINAPDHKLHLNK